ncbi:MAG: PTS sugar transporter subunit IIA [Lentisphaeria bacterium]|nr:PTS sugar transporter subunit IIA [Lentisphaeria bacterium]
MEEANKQKFSDYLSLNNILCNVAGADEETVLCKLLEALNRHYPKLDIKNAGDEVRARESMFSTVIAPGLAVPHARIAGLPFPLVAVASTPQGVTVSNSDDKVIMTVLVLTPLDEPNLHLQILAALSSVFADSKRLEALAAVTDANSFFAALTNAEGEDDLPSFLQAADVMSIPPATLLETDTVGHAIRTFATTKSEELPVLDNSGDLRGVLALTDLLRYSLPKHLLWMENLTPIYQFQPFAEMLKTAEENKVADVMREEVITVEADVPAVQLAKLFLVDKVSQLIITRDGKYAGVVELKSFCARLFWE